MNTFIIILLLVIAGISSYQLYLSITASRVKRGKEQPFFVDTSVLIDGRIIAVAQSGFMTAPLYIPRSVVGELQLLADGSDSDKRSRARHGLDVVKQLQEIPGVTVVIFLDSETAREGVDNRLLALAKKHGGALCTIDFNLNKVAQVEGLKVVNVNDLAKSLRMAYLPGEKLLLEITQKGNDAHQGIGHLTDGTMVVVEHASQLVGKMVEIEFIRSLQTAAGKMMFAKVVNAPKQPAQKNDAPAKRAAAQKPSGRKQVTERPQRKVVDKKPATKPQNSARHPRKKPLTNEERLVELANSQN
ncbi:hypothetical protein CL689_04475 [Candidatus Saccharibacteria bacterium]|nr:hypothetical protein [Candidatus Saccharibacteria bacterium]MBJ58282.1 hypothetical protein [Candidatus Saccharibacteria bacterium]MBQ69297.1 hypothetical protein [Candidatus Saccharibacteria bacterium]|tara:strand:- start:78 stop:980 length:903 start_codon:yes stop_codon:yes gene_type:complete